MTVRHGIKALALFVGLVLGGLMMSSWAHAETEVSDGFEYRYRSTLGGVSYSSGWLPSKPSACAAFVAAVSAQNERPVISSQYIESNGVCEVRFRSCPGEGCNPNNYLRPNPEQRESTCPAGHWWVEGECQPPPNCTAGDVIDVEWFTGWGVPGGKSDGTGGVPPSTATIGACEYTRGSLGDCYTYEANESKYFCQFQYTATGNASTAPPLQNNAPAEACLAGHTYGTVNGKAGCYPTADPTQPDNTNPTPTKPGVPTAPGTAGPGAGGGAGDGTGTGDGPNGGGMPGGGSSGDPGGDDMPSADGAYSGALGELDAAAQARENQIKAQGGDARRTELPFIFDVANVLPNGGCSPLSLATPFGTVSNNWCDELGEFRSIWGWFLAMLAALYVWQLGHSALKQGR